MIAGQLNDQQISRPQPTTQVLDHSDSVASEVNKVKRRLKLWAKRPDQINTQILKAYLALEATSSNSVSVDDLAKAFDEPNKFSSNFNQMCIIAPHNHGKIFEVKQGEVSIWPPVADLVDDFKKAIEPWSAV